MAKVIIICASNTQTKILLMEQIGLESSCFNTNPIIIAVLKTRVQAYDRWRRHILNDAKWLFHHPWIIITGRHNLAQSKKCILAFTYWKMTHAFFFFFPCFLGSYSWHMEVPRGWIGAEVANLCQSHSNTRYERSLQPTPELTAVPDPRPTDGGQESNPRPHGY